MSTEVNENPVDVLTSVAEWLEERDYKTALQGPYLYFSKPPSTALSTLELLENPDVFILDLNDESQDDEDRHTHWTTPYVRDNASTLSLILFVFSTKLGENKTSLNETNPNEQEVMATRLQKAEILARNAEARIAELTGEGLPNAWDLARRENPEIFSLGLWSTYRFSADAPLSHRSNRLFYAPLGQEGQGFSSMTISETNLKEGGRVSMGHGADVKFIMAEAFGCAKDIELMRQFGVIRLDLIQTVIDVGPLGLIIPQGKGQGIVKIGEPGKDAPETTVGLCSVFGEAGWHIPSNTTFGMLLSFGPTPPLQDDISVRITLGCCFPKAIEIG